MLSAIVPESEVEDSQPTVDVVKLDENLAIECNQWCKEKLFEYAPELGCVGPHFEEAGQHLLSLVCESGGIDFDTLRARTSLTTRIVDTDQEEMEDLEADTLGSLQ